MICSWINTIDSATHRFGHSSLKGKTISEYKINSCKCQNTSNIAYALWWLKLYFHFNRIEKQATGKLYSLMTHLRLMNLFFNNVALWKWTSLKLWKKSNLMVGVLFTVSSGCINTPEDRDNNCLHEWVIDSWIYSIRINSGTEHVAV